MLLLEAVARQWLFGLALRTMIRAVAIGIGNGFQIVFDRASEWV
jgi:hypothetical protein